MEGWKIVIGYIEDLLIHYKTHEEQLEIMEKGLKDWQKTMLK